MPLWVSLRASLRVPLRMTLWMTLRVPRRRLIWSWTIVLLRISVESLILRWESLIYRLVLVLSIHLRVLVPNEHLRGNLLGKTLHRTMEPLITFSQFSLVSTGPLKQILNDFLKFLVVYFEYVNYFLITQLENVFALQVFFSQLFGKIQILDHIEQVLKHVWPLNLTLLELGELM